MRFVNRCHTGDNDIVLHANRFAVRKLVGKHPLLVVKSDHAMLHIALS